MLDLLSDFLNHATTPEEKVKVEIAVAALDRIGVEDYEQAIEELLMTDDEVDTGSTLFNILALIRSVLHHTLHMHAVTLSEDTDMQMLANVVTGLLDLQEHEEKNAIVSIINSDASLNERFCELMRMVTPYEVDELLQFIVVISPSLLTRLYDQEEEQEEDEAVTLGRAARLDAYRRYVTHLPDGAPAQIRQMLKAGVDVGMPYTVYANVVGAQFEHMQIEEIAEEMIGFALISSDGHTRPSDTIKSHMEVYLSDVALITAVMTRVNQILNGFKP